MYRTSFSFRLISNALDLLSKEEEEVEGDDDDDDDDPQWIGSAHA